MGSRKEHTTLLNQTRPRNGQPPNHVRRSTTFDNSSVRLQPGDTLVVWKADRLSRSLLDLVRIAQDLEKRGIAFKSLTESFDTTTAAGRMTLNILGTFAQFERDMIRERTHAGLRTARAAGRVGGRRFKFNPLKAAEIVRAIRNGEKTPTEIARMEEVHPKTIRRLLARS
jgi:DNA invertase Pin-like site-specific DNA recombinase